jgi:hypothetical protein
LRKIAGQPDCNYKVTVQMDFVRSGTMLGGSGMTTLFSISGGGSSCQQGTLPESDPIVILLGSTDGINVNLTMRLGPPGQTIVFDFKGTVAGMRMSGTMSGTNQGPQGLETFSGTWALVRQ